MFLRPFIISDIRKRIKYQHQWWSVFPPICLIFWRWIWADVSLPVQYFWHRKQDLIPAPIMVGFPPMRLIFGVKVEWMFLRLFLISDIRKDFISAPMTIVFPFNASYFGAKVEWMFLRPFLISDHQKKDLIPAPIMGGFLSDASYFWCQKSVGCSSAH